MEDFMKFKYLIFWALTAVITANLIACNKKDDDNKGNTNNGKPAGAAPAVAGGAQAGSGTNPDQGVKKETTVNGKAITLELTDIILNESATKSGNGILVDFKIKVNNTEAMKSIALQETDKTEYGTNYSLIEGWHVYWLAKCESTTSCDRVTVTVIATDSGGKKWVQVGLMKSLSAGTVYGRLAYPYPEQKDQIVSPAILELTEIESRILEASTAVW